MAEAVVEMVIPSPVALTVTFPGWAVAVGPWEPPLDPDGIPVPPDPEAATAGAGRASPVKQTNAAA
jgi:hypothetical protein